MSFKDRLKSAREFQGLTQKDLAKKLNVSASMIGQYEIGHRKPKTETLEKIAKALNMHCGISEYGFVYFYFQDKQGLDINPDQKRFNFEQLMDIEKDENKAKIDSHNKILEILTHSPVSAGFYVQDMVNRLNREGQTKIIEYVQDISKISEYQNPNYEEDIEKHYKKYDDSSENQEKNSF